MARIHLILAMLSLLAVVASASAPLFCKCSCFKNSTIIPLDPQYQPPGSPGAPASGGSLSSSSSSSTRSSSCMQCTRAFCLGNNLPICRGAEETTDVVAMCFQRDSRKDQIIVWGFLLATTGLLGWAGAQRLLQRRAERSGGRRGAPTSPVGSHGGLRSGAGYAPLDGGRDNGR